MVAHGKKTVGETLITASKRYLKKEGCCPVVVIDCHQIDESYAASAGMSVTYANDSTTYSSVALASCRPGTIPLGASEWSCDRHGQWSIPRSFHCRGIRLGLTMMLSFT